MTPIERFDSVAVERHFKKPGTRRLMGDVALHLRHSMPVDAAQFEAALKDFCDSRGIKLKEIAGPLRLATTWRDTGFCLFESCAILGIEDVCARIVDAAYLMAGE